MDLLNRHRNLTVLLLVLFAQVIGLAVQIKGPPERGSRRLIHSWGVALVSPVEKALVHTQTGAGNLWRNYFYLRSLRKENQRLEDENAHLRLEQVRMMQDATQAQRLQALLKFKEQFIAETIAAQVIGSSGSEHSRLIYIDKGAHDGIKQDMAVISPEGIVGKILTVYPTTSQVLQINDQASGVGAILEKSRLQGILNGTPAGEMMLHYIMADEQVPMGEMVLTSGGDRVFPKGLAIGRVVQVNPGPDTFLNIRVRPAARLDRLEEVLVISNVVEKETPSVPEAPMRAADILAQRLPTVTPKPPDAKPDATAASATPGTKPATPATAAAPNANKAKPEGATQPKPQVAGAVGVKPGTPQGTAAPQKPGTDASTAKKPKPQPEGAAQSKPQPAGANGAKPRPKGQQGSAPPAKPTTPATPVAEQNNRGPE